MPWSGVRFAVSLSLVVAALTPAAAAPAPQMTAPRSAWSALEEGGTPPSAQVRRARLVQVDRAALRQQLLSGDLLFLDLMPDVSLLAESVRVSDDPLNGFVWRGRVVGEPLSMVTLVLEPEGLAGTVLYSGGAYELRLRGAGVSEIREMGPQAERPDRVLVPPGREPRERALGGDLQAGGKGDGRIDMLVLFAPQAMRDLNGRRATVAAARTAIANFQTALENSEIPAEVRLMRARRIPYSKRGSSGDDMVEALEDITNPDNNQMRQAQRLRDRFGADIVTLVTEFNEDYCGVGWVNGRGNGVLPEDEEYAFNAVSSDCLAGGSGLTLAHEAGHNMGFNHDRDNTGAAWPWGAYDYSHGHRVPGNFRTVMAYACGPDGLAGCPRIAFFSNPQVRHQGARTGMRTNHRRSAHNARSLTRDIDVISAWRPCERRCNE